jgi:hypothetical protein
MIDCEPTDEELFNRDKSLHAMTEFLDDAKSVSAYITESQTLTAAFLLGMALVYSANIVADSLKAKPANA